MSVTDTRTPNPAGLDPAAVAARAYAIWVRGGRRPARALEDWLQAERELRDESAKAEPAGACCAHAMPAPAPAAAPAPAPSVPPAPAPAPAPTPTAPAAAKPPSKPPVGQRPAKKGRGGKRR